MNDPQATLFDPQEVRRLVARYGIEGYLFGTVSSDFAESGTLSPYDFFAIIIWKANRTKRKIIRGLTRVDRTVDALMREVSTAATLAEKVSTLLQVPGIGLAMASAILTVCYPDQFTVLDYRAWDTLRSNEVPELPFRYPITTTEYLQYCAACRDLAQQLDLSLREMDRVLWAKDWEDDLLRLTQGLQ